MPKFTSVIKVEELLKLLETPIKGTIDETFAAMRKGTEDAKKRLADKTREAQQKNTEWIQGRFQEYREAFPFADCILIDEDGRNVPGALWQTFGSYCNYPELSLPPTLDELYSFVMERRKIFYEFVPEDRMFVFFLARDSKKLEEFGVKPHIYAKIEDEPILFAYTKPSRKHDILGPSSLKSKNIAVGRMGFWPRCPEKQAPENVRYEPRIWVYEHPASNVVYIESVGKIKRHLSGLLLETEKKGREHWIRIELPQSQDVIQKYPDFISRAFYAYLDDNRVNSVSPLFRYSIPSPPWSCKTFYLHNESTKTLKEGKKV